MDALKYMPELGEKRTSLIEWCKDKLIEHKEYIHEYGEDMPEIRNWKW
jgi:xylulose-5-phosphate/fructose-6-phosphate phosphoketolase